MKPFDTTHEEKETLGGKHKKRQSKPCMHSVTPRGTQCDSLGIIASLFSRIIATESREELN